MEADGGLRLKQALARDYLKVSLFYKTKIPGALPNAGVREANAPSERIIKKHIAFLLSDADILKEKYDRKSSDDYQFSVKSNHCRVESSP